MWVCGMAAAHALSQIAGIFNRAAITQKNAFNESMRNVHSGQYKIQTVIVEPQRADSYSVWRDLLSWTFNESMRNVHSGQYKIQTVIVEPQRADSYSVWRDRKYHSSTVARGHSTRVYTTSNADNTRFKRSSWSRRELTATPCGEIVSVIVVLSWTFNESKRNVHSGQYKIQTVIVEPQRADCYSVWRDRKYHSSTVARGHSTRVCTTSTAGNTRFKRSSWSRRELTATPCGEIVSVIVVLSWTFNETMRNVNSGQYKIKTVIVEPQRADSYSSREVRPGDLAYLMESLCSKVMKPIAVVGPQTPTSDGAIRHQCARAHIPHIQASWQPLDPDSEPDNQDDDENETQDEDVEPTFKKISINFHPESDELSIALARLLNFYKWESFTV
ncbi:Ionotropic glutamate receptor [Operophtera brumata]|uniref:Ionotropic glutamate receptor n=1 Tax=Operophtera brumata TaxID=104452 RepID=A0A0L7LUF6_OPEBR|nr:Ionotropic glutamate receptor [Operophtera brumata]